MNEKIWRRPKWMKLAARAIHPLQDRELRRHLTNLYKAILRVMQNPKSPRIESSEQYVVENSLLVLERYKKLFFLSDLDHVPNEHLKICALISLMFESARKYVNHSQGKEKLEVIINDFVRVIPTNLFKLIGEQPVFH